VGGALWATSAEAKQKARLMPGFFWFSQCRDQITLARNAVNPQISGYRI
jgi:hypothetical protein